MRYRIAGYVLLGIVLLASPAPAAEAEPSARWSAELDAVLGALENPGPGGVERELRALVEAGNARAAHTLGMMNQRGVGVPNVNNCAARDWFARAAELGYPASLVAIGLLYQEGRCVERDYDKAADYYERAVAQDAPDAEIMLALLYIRSDWAAHDISLARELAKRSLEAARTQRERDVRAAQLGSLYLDGSDREHTEQNLTPQAERGEPIVQLLLGIALWVGNQPERLDEALIWIQLAAEQGNRFAASLRNGLIETYGRDRLARAREAARARIETLAADPESELAQGVRWCRIRHMASDDCLRMAYYSHSHCALDLTESSIQARLVRTRMYDRCRTQLLETPPPRGWPLP